MRVIKKSGGANEEAKKIFGAIPPWPPRKTPLCTRAFRTKVMIKFMVEYEKRILGALLGDI